MDEDSKRPPDEGDDIAPWQKLDRVVLSIARLVGKRMAREDFERLKASVANDNRSPDATSNADEPDEKGP